MKLSRKIISVIALFLSFIICLTACSNTNNVKNFNTFLTVDVYDSLANDKGIQTGWYAAQIKNRFNIELNIITPNDSGTASDIFETRLASGDVGDIIICGSSDLQRLIEADMVLDMTPYLKDSNIMKNFAYPVNTFNKSFSQNSIYAIPSNLSTNTPLTPSENSVATYGSYVRWDYYKELGYPEIDVFEDWLPVLQKMKDAHPTSDSGQPTYAFSFFPDWDANLMTAIKQPCCMYGYDELGFVLAKADGSDFQNILEDTSLYYRFLKFYNKAYQQGLLDPDSRNNSYNDVSQKYADGQILFSPWPWLGQPSYNTTEHVSASKGYMFVPIKDEEIYSYGCENFGNHDSVIAIGKNVSSPSQVVAFIDWLYSPEGIMYSCASTQQGTAGPLGLTYEVTEQGPQLTEIGKKALIDGDAEIPDIWGGGTWKAGACMLNYTPISKVELTPEGYPYYFSSWDSYINDSRSNLDMEWSNYMGVDTVMEYLEKTDGYIVSPGVNYTPASLDVEMSTIRKQCAKTIVDYSWKMVYAEDDATFKVLYDELIKKVKALGYDKICAQDLKNAKEEAELKFQLINEQEE